MSESRISLRHVRIALHVAIAWQVVLVALESQRGWMFVQYAVWLTPIAALLVVLEVVMWGVTENAFDRARIRPDLQALRLRSSLVVYLAAVVTFTREALVASIAYTVLRACVAPLHRRRLVWMSVDVAMIVASLVWLAIGELDVFGFASVLTVMVAVVTVAIYQDDTSR